jgi:hypothetical protein
MMVRCNRFNLYLLLALAPALICGCLTAKSREKGRLSALRLHQEVNRDIPERSEVVEVHKDPTITLRIDKQPFLTEAYVKQARVIEAAGGFALQIQFNKEGSWLLEQYTAGSRGKHIAIFCQFAMPPEKKLNVGRWLAAPRFTTHITDGLLVIIPDATREEAEQIALGLNNVARKEQTE